MMHNPHPQVLAQIIGTAAIDGVTVWIWDATTPEGATADAGVAANMVTANINAAITTEMLFLFTGGSIS
jgi:hypothetical protein